MKSIEHIAARDRQLPFTVPEGYFDGLRERVLARCGAPPAAEEKKRLRLWSALRPQLAFAAGFALLVGVATLAVRLTATPSLDSPGEAALTTSYLSVFDIQAYEEYAEAQEEAEADDAIVDYLCSAGCWAVVGYY